MIVLHANWADGRLHFWGERARDLPAPGADDAHPFAATHEELRAALARAAGFSAGEHASVSLLLPSRGGRPAASPRLAHLSGHAESLEDASSTVPTMRRWSAPSIAVDPAACSAPLEALEDIGLDPDERMDRETRSDVAVGPGAEFFAACARLARALVAEQRFVPALLQEPAGDLRGLWQPWVSDEATAERVAALLRAMPPAARAAVDALEHDAWAILEDALNRIVDAAARRALAAERMEEAVEDRPLSDPSVAWLRGLLGDADAAPAPPEARAPLIRSVRQWLASLEDRGGNSAWRLLLRLEEPLPSTLPKDLREPGEDTVWTLAFLLQSLDDPEAVMHAEEVWTLSSDTALVQGKRIEAPQELLLAELARAARVYPRLESALRDGEPAELELNTAQAYEFLREVRPLLLEQGFGAEAPEWWEAPTSRLGARLQIDAEPPPADAASGGGSGSAAGPRVGLDALVNYRWQIAVGETTLSLKEFESLAAQRAPLVRVHGQWVEIRAEDVRAAVQFIKDNPGGKIRVADAMRLAFAWETERTGVPILGMDASGWVSSLLEGANETLPMVEQPGGFQGALRPYQARGLSWLAFLDRYGVGACLADDMGLGKTVQLIALLVHERERAAADPAAERVRPTLIVAPMSVVENWLRELRRFAPGLKALVHHGATRRQGDDLAEVATAADVTLTTYALAHRDRDRLGKVEWGRVVLDEAQNVKNPSAKQSQAVRAFKAPRRIALTGTPVENRLSELWSIMDFCSPGLLGSSAEFRRRFAVPIERHHDKNRSRQLRALVQPFVLRRLKTDPTITADLPAKVETKERCRLTPEQAALYESTVKRMLAEADATEGIQRRGIVLASLVRLKQICNHPSQLLKDHDFSAGQPPDRMRSGKTARLVELLDEALSAGDQALVFTQFREMGRLLQAILTHDLDREVMFLHGGTAPGARQQMIDRFQRADGSAPIFILSLKAGGVGLNLTAANHVFHFDRWWNPAVENQATDRAHRIGQTRTVQVHKFVVSGTLEERIDQMIEQKTDLAERIIGAGEQWLTELSTSQLRELVALGPDAVEDDDEDDRPRKAPARRPDAEPAALSAADLSDEDFGAMLSTTGDA